MNDFVQALFSQRFIAHGFCMRWESDVLWLHALSDTAIAAAYFCIPVLLLSFMKKRRDIPFHWILAAFSLFIICCGLTHAMDVVTLWFPFYRLAGALKAATAVVSVGTAVGLTALTPLLMRLPSLKQLQLANRALDCEIVQRKKVEVELVEAYRLMEEKVRVRTLQLASANDAQIRSEIQFRETFEQAAIGLAHVAVDGRFLRLNNRFCEIVGYAREELLEMTFGDITHADDLEADWALARGLLAGTANEYRMEKRYIRKGDEVVWVNLTGKLVARDGRPDYFIAAVENITERKQAEARVLESERRFKEMANAMPQIVWTATPSGRIDFYNDRWYELTGAKQNGLDIRHSAMEPDDYARWLAVWRDSLHERQAYEIHHRFWDYKRQEFRWYLGRATPVKDQEGNVSRWIGTCTDIHEQKSAENSLDHLVRERTMALERSLLEKEILLKEIHHRVKNNLQVISSLLRMQSETLGTADAAAALKDSQRRVLSMAMIHEQLYGGSRMDEIDFEDYSKALTNELFSSLGSEHISLRLRTSRVLLKIDHAIPCGLILSELVTNALKYAFPHHLEGEIVVELAQDEHGVVTLTVVDNGVGLPAGFDLSSSRSLGLPIVQILTKQIGGKLIVQTWPGASFSVVFRTDTQSSSEGVRVVTQTA